MTCYVLSILNTSFVLKYLWEGFFMYKRIKELREDHDKKQLEVANVLKISQQYYSE